MSAQLCEQPNPHALSLIFQAGATGSVNLLADAEKLLTAQGDLFTHLKPWAQDLLRGIRSLPLHAVAQLLLTTGRSTDVKHYEHDVQTSDLLSMASYRHLAVHPTRVGELLLGNQTDYPAVLARGIGEHHERLNGTGYPARADSSTMSALDSCLAAAEAIVGLASNTPPAPWARANLAMRLFPGEFSAQAQAFTNQLEKWANEHTERDLLNHRDESLQQAQDLLARIESGMTLSRQMARESLSCKARSVSTLSFGYLQVLHKTGHSLGLWGFPTDFAGEASFEFYAALREISFRVTDIKRNACLAESKLSPRDEEELDKLWLCLNVTQSDNLTASA
jgi:HD domain